MLGVRIPVLKVTWISKHYDKKFVQPLTYQNIILIVRLTITFSSSLKKSLAI